MTAPTGDRATEAPGQKPWGAEAPEAEAARAKKFPEKLDSVTPIVYNSLIQLMKGKQMETEIFTTHCPTCGAWTNTELHDTEKTFIVCEHCGTGYEA
jgi:hypothetical protein